MATAVSPTPLSNLDLVRQVEEETARQITDARAQANQVIRQAEAQARAILKEAHSANQQIRQLKYEHLIAGSRAEAQTLIEEAKLRAEEIRQSANAHRKAAVEFAAGYVLGVSSGKEKS